MPPEARFPTPFRPVVVRFGKPVDTTRYMDRANDRLVLRQIIDEVMFAIRELSGQEYRNTYATKKAEVAPTEVTQVGDPRPSTNGHAPVNGSASAAAPDEPEAPRSAAAALAGARRRS